MYMKSSLDYRISKKLKRASESGGGSFGSYYKIGKYRGIKILCKSFDTVEEVLKSKSYKDALRECEILQLLTKRGCKFTPKCYGIRIVKSKAQEISGWLKGEYGFRIGIVMQHLGTRTLSDRDLKDEDEIVNSFINRLMDEYRVKNNDLHSNNIMWYKRKYWVIDFSPCFITLI